MGCKESNQTKKILVSCCDISRGGGGGGYSDILVIYVGSDHFLGFKTLNFNTFLGFHKKKEYFWRGRGGGGGGMKKLLISFSGLFWGSFLYILGFFKDRGTEWEYFWGIT